MVASKLGADCNLESSPEKEKLGCCPELLEVELLVLLLELGDTLKRAQGTAICFPPELLEVEPRALEVPPGEEAPPVELLVLWPLVSVELVPGEVELELLLVPPGLVAEPVLLEPLELKERTAKSIRPELGLMITSLMVPS